VSFEVYVYSNAQQGARCCVVVFSIFMKYEEDSTFHFKKGSRGVVARSSFSVGLIRRLNRTSSLSSARASAFVFMRKILLSNYFSLNWFSRVLSFPVL
jgi:hypothetical protein